MRDLRGGGGVFLPLIKAAGIKSRDSEIKKQTRSGPIRGAFAVVGLCFCTSLLAARCPALAHAHGMLDRVLYAAAFFLLLIYTMDSQLYFKKTPHYRGDPAETAVG